MTSSLNGPEHLGGGILILSRIVAPTIETLFVLRELLGSCPKRYFGGSRYALTCSANPPSFSTKQHGSIWSCVRKTVQRARL